MKKKENNPNVSIIIPTYNRAYLLGKSIRSVLNQTYQDFELIAIDDGSTDNTQEVVNSFTDKRIRYVKLEKNKGAAAARNVGLKVAKGKYIAFQDSDDEWLPEKLEKQINIFKCLSDKVDIVYTDMNYISRDGKGISYWESPHLDLKDSNNYQKVLCYPFLKNCGIGIQSTLIRRGCFDKAGVFDERFPMFIDLEMFIRLSYYFQFFHMQEPLVNFHFTANSITSAKGGNRHIIANNLIFQKHFKHIRKDKKLLAKYCSWLSERMIYSKDTFNQGRKYLIMHFLTRPLNVKLFLKSLLSFLGVDFYLKMSNVGYRFKKLWWHVLRIAGNLNID